MFAFLRDIKVLKEQVAMLMGQKQTKIVRPHVGRKLNAEKVQAIKTALRDGATQTALSRQYGVSVGIISKIAHGELWKNVSI